MLILQQHHMTFKCDNIIHKLVTFDTGVKKIISVCLDPIIASAY